MGSRQVIIPIFVPHRGCSHQCTFCNQKSISGQLEDMTPRLVTHIIEDHLKTIKPGRFTELAFYGGSFTAIDQTTQIMLLEAVQPYLKDGRISEIRLSTRPDCIDAENLSMLRSYGVKTIELGAQSMDDEVLKACRRGHVAVDTFHSAKLIRQSGFQLGIQTMTGLPEDDWESCLETARRVCSLRPDFVRIYPVLVIRGTALEKQYLNGMYQPQKLEEAVLLCAELLQLYDKEGIPVIRIGLQSTDRINEHQDSDVIAGPVHPAIRQLVESRLMLDRIEAELSKRVWAAGSVLHIETNPANISNVVGQKKTNIQALMRHHELSAIKVVPNAGTGREFMLSFH